MTSASIGRNDPCPCGSGRKYKNCCMRKDRLETARAIAASGEEAELYTSLARFVSEPRFATVVNEGISIFWRGQYAAEAGAAIDAEGARRMIEWLVIDYRYGADHKRLIDLHAATESRGLPQSTQQLVQAWADSRMGAFRYLARSDEERLAVFDTLADTQATLRSRVIAQNAHPGDLLVSHVYELDGERWLTPATLILPREFEQPLVDYVRNAQRLYLDEHPGTTLDQFLRANGHIFNAFLLSARAESLRALVGPGTRYPDPAATRDRMRAITRERENAQAAREIVTVDDLQPQPDAHRTASGIVLPGAKEPPGGETETATQHCPTVLVPGRDT